MSKYGSKIEIKLWDTFYIRPFPIKEVEKIIVDIEMRRGHLLGVLREDVSN